MTEAVLSSPAQAYAEFGWWRIHHSRDEDRLAMMLSSYYDESAVDGAGPVSAVGGLVLNHHQYANLGIEWDRILTKENFPKNFIHMKDFGEHGDLHDYPLDRKRALFERLSWAINDNKQFSVGSTLTPEEYKRHFSFLKTSKRSGGKSDFIGIHGACFMLSAVVQGRWAESVGYRHNIPFMLDEGCPDHDRADIDKAHIVLRDEFPVIRPDIVTHAGGLTWEDDKQFPALQAADIIAWAVRRQAAQLPFNGGTESLPNLLARKRHLDNHFEQDWMKEQAADIRTILEG